MLWGKVLLVTWSGKLQPRNCSSSLYPASQLEARLAGLLQEWPGTVESVKVNL